VTESSLTRILIVDDEVAQMSALCETLSAHGYETQGVPSGREALIALQNQSFDLILTDLMMPEMDGIAVLKAALEIDPNLVGIMMTGAGTIATAVEAMKSGALDYILKPFKVSAILPVLSRALAVRQLRVENAELTRSLKQRTIDLEAANLELEAFSSSVSHDLRAPLRAINGFAIMLLEDYQEQLPVDAQGQLHTIIDSARQMSSLIDDLLRLARLGRHTLRKESLDVRKLVDLVIQELRTDVSERELKFQIGALPKCFADKNLLKQVYVNLLSNAIKFTRHRQQAIIEIECDERTGEKVFSVRDNGAGFDMQGAGANLFGDFQRFHSQQEFEGTGIGLSIVRRIVERHGGRVWADAEVGKGATFFFSMPN
jgi:two-component system, sensor histidine kinase and response regulator